MLSMLIFVCFALTTAKEISTPEYSFIVRQNATLDCSSLGSAKFYQGGKLITSETFPNVQIIDENKLFFNNLTLEQISSNYRCINEESKNYILFNKHPVILIESSHSMQKLVDGMFEIKVKVFNVENNCSWIQFKNNSIVNITQTDTITIEKHSMSIRNLKQDSAGNYGCLIFNNYGLFVGYSVVEVKSVASTLWLFLVVSIQVFLCCVAIFAYEKFSIKKKDDNQYNLSQQHFFKGRMASA